jgi:hypothetical protein
MFFLLKKKKTISTSPAFLYSEKQKECKTKNKKTVNGPSWRPDPLPVPSGGATVYEMRRQINW